MDYGTWRFGSNPKNIKQVLSDVNFPGNTLKFVITILKVEFVFSDVSNYIQGIILININFNSKIILEYCSDYYEKIITTGIYDILRKVYFDDQIDNDCTDNWFHHWRLTNWASCVWPWQSMEAKANLRVNCRRLVGRCIISQPISLDRS